MSRGSVSPGSGRQKSTILQDLGLSDDEWDKPTASGYLALHTPAHMLRMMRNLQPESNVHTSYAFYVYFLVIK